MGAEKLYVMFYVIYLSLCLGIFLKFRIYGIKGWCLLFSLFMPIIGVIIALLFPIKYLRDKGEYTFLKKITIFPYLVYFTIKVYPIIVGFVADNIKFVLEKNKKRNRKSKGSNIGVIFWPKVEKCYTVATEVRFGI